jgi:Rieske Fe-S protein
MLHLSCIVQIINAVHYKTNAAITKYNCIVHFSTFDPSLRQNSSFLSNAGTTAFYA